jgi:hypothetical protein
MPPKKQVPKKQGNVLFMRENENFSWLEGGKSLVEVG